MIRLVAGLICRALNKPAESMGQWLVKNMANLGELNLPDRKEPPREIPFK